MTSVSEISYLACLNNFKNLMPQLSPEIVVTDFEMSLRNEDIVGNFNELVQSLSNSLRADFQSFINYYERFWIERITPHGFSIYGFELFTTNVIDSYHARLKNKLSGTVQLDIEINEQLELNEVIHDQSLEVIENDQRNNYDPVDNSDSDPPFNENPDDMEEELMNIQGVPVLNEKVEFVDLPFPEDPVEPISAQRIPVRRYNLGKFQILLFLHIISIVHICIRTR